MKDIVKMQQKLKKQLPSKRFFHSIEVSKLAKEYAKIYGLDVEKAEVAGLLHDCGRKIPTPEQLSEAKRLGLEIDFVEKNQPILLHAKLGVYFAKKEFEIEDPEILEAIEFHSTGGENLSKLAMIVYLADLLEPNRAFSGINDLRKLATEDLELAMIKAYEQSIKYLLERGLLIHPKCVFGRNELVAKRKEDVRIFK